MKIVNKVLHNELYQKTMREISELEKDRIFCKHDIEHLLNAARIMIIEVLEKNININREIIYITALLHDIGRAEEYVNNEPHSIAGIRVANEILYQCGVSYENKNMILTAISSHNNHEKTNELGKILKTADKLSRNCYLCSAYSQCKWSDEKKNKNIRV